MKAETKCYCGHTTTCDCGPEEPKQETLEEAAEKYVEINVAKNVAKLMYKEHFINGAKWQQERSYSEEELLEILASYADWSINGNCTYYEWFKQFKKK